ncbi:unnamed protein product [Closterium sp. NIES-64]|nr:unnamed protein product [Closterium sp. NIES-64]
MKAEAAGEGASATFDQFRHHQETPNQLRRDVRRYAFDHNLLRRGVQDPFSQEARIFRIHPGCVDFTASAPSSSTFFPPSFLSRPVVILQVNGKLAVTGEGDVVLQSPYGEVKLENVLLVEDLKVNLVSQSQLDDLGCKIFYDSRKVTVFGSDWEKYADGYFSDGFYEMNLGAMNDKDEIYEDPESTEDDESDDSDDMAASVEAAVNQEEEIVIMEAAAVNGGDGDDVNTFAAAIDEAVNAKCVGVAVKGDIMVKGSKANATAKGQVLKEDEHVEGYETREVLSVEMPRSSERIKKMFQGLDVKALNFKTRKQRFKVQELQGSVNPT